MSLKLNKLMELPYFKAISAEKQDKIKQNYELADESAREALCLHLARANEFFVQLRDEKDPVAKKAYFVGALQTGVENLKNRVKKMKSKVFAELEEKEKVKAEEVLGRNLKNINK
jgi:hypothetical protein